MDKLRILAWVLILAALGFDVVLLRGLSLRARRESRRWLGEE